MAVTDRTAASSSGASGASGEGEDGDFSVELERWLRSDGPKSVGALTEVFGEKSFAVIILVLMFFPALPVPSGGITHVFEAIAVIVALQMIAGRDTLWLPERWRDRELSGKAMDKAIPFMVRRIRWFERFSKPRMTWIFTREVPKRLLGVLVIAFTVGSAIAPPFSGLDTLPALGVVVIALAIILEDALLLGIGTVIGVGGITLIVTIGAAVARVVKGWL